MVIQCTRLIKLRTVFMCEACVWCGWQLFSEWGSVVGSFTNWWIEDENMTPTYLHYVSSFTSCLERTKRWENQENRVFWPKLDCIMLKWSWLFLCLYLKVGVQSIRGRLLHIAIQHYAKLGFKITIGSITSASQKRIISWKCSFFLLSLVQKVKLSWILYSLHIT